MICEAISHPNGGEAIQPQLQAAAADDALAEAMLDTGLQQLQAKPPSLPKSAYFVLSFIANPDRGSNKAGRLQRLIKLQRLMLEQTPSPQAYSEIVDTLRRMDQNAEAAATLQQMIDKYPEQPERSYPGTARGAGAACRSYRGGAGRGLAGRPTRRQ